MSAGIDKHRAYVRKFGSRCQGNEGNVDRKNPGDGAFGPKREIWLGGGAGFWDSSSDPPLIDR